MEVPVQDPRVYHAFTLPTGIQCLVISDPTPDHKAAAAVCVAAGQLQDGATQGRAHLLEHAVFMGTTRYPVENEYDAYLAQHGGHSNAYTDLEKTCYYCDVAPACLEETVTRLSSCLREPLLQAPALQRELQAVDSEHGKNAQSDFWRANQLAKSILGGGLSLDDDDDNETDNDNETDKDATTPNNEPPPHPYAGFGTGNLQSFLGTTDKETTLDEADMTARVALLQAAVQDFFEQYYTAENLTVTILGQESIDVLQGWVETAFGDWRTSATPRAPVPPLNTHALLPVEVHYVPVRPVRSVELQWMWPELQSYYLVKPGRVLSHLLGHEGPGSLLAALRKRAWAQELYADDQSKSGTAFSAFVLHIELTQQGFANVDKVIHMAYHYLSLLQDLPAWVHAELQTTADMQFRFLSQRDPVDTVSGLASQMHDYPAKHYVSGPYKVFAPYDAAATRRLHDLLVPNNMLVLLAAQDYDPTNHDTENDKDIAATSATPRTNRVDPWYGTQYSIHKSTDWSYLTEQALDPELAADLALAKPNEMLASDFTILASSKDGKPPKDLVPVCLLDSDMCRLWYQPDLIFQQPKVNAMFLFRVNLQTPRRAVLAALWAEVMHEVCNEAFSYEASMAGLHGDFSATSAGLELSLSGYSDKAHILLQKLMTALMDMPQALTSELVGRIRVKLQEQYMAFLVGQPYQHALHMADLLLEETKSSIQDRLAEMDSIDAQDVCVFTKEFLRHVSLEALVHGNVSAETALSWAQTIVLAPLEAAGARPATDPSPLRVVQLPPTTTVLQQAGWNDQDENSVVYNLFQIGVVDTQANARLSVLHHLLREPAFNQLRTEEQLGYIVHSSIKTNQQIKAWQILIQSDQYDPVHMQTRIDVFLQAYRTKLLQMTPESYQTNVAAVCRNLLEKSKNLSEESSKLWRVVSNQTYHWQRLEEIAAAAATTTQQEILIFFDKYIRRRAQGTLCLHWYAKKHLDNAAAAATMQVVDPKALGRQQALYPASPRGTVPVATTTTKSV